LSARRVVCALLLFLAPCLGQELTIAAASDLQRVLPELAGAFEKQTGEKVRLVFGSSGNLYAQIQNGAPFDIFFSADVDYPKRLEAASLAKKGSVYVYGTGELVVWDPSARLDFQRRGLKALLDPGIKHIAIANPAHAPYGRAAKAALEKAGVWETVKAKIVLGENVSQAAQFVQSGNAEVGIIAASLTHTPAFAMQRVWAVPQELYPRLEQGVVVLTATKHGGIAERFVAFLQSRAGRAVMERYGFRGARREAK
jgi:molybdate transport system substrate-binding protein